MHLMVGEVILRLNELFLHKALGMIITRLLWGGPMETDNIYMEAVIPRVKFIKPMSYEMSEKMIEGYAQIILESE